MSQPSCLQPLSVNLHFHSNIEPKNNKFLVIPYSFGRHSKRASQFIDKTISSSNLQIIIALQFKPTSFIANTNTKRPMKAGKAGNIDLLLRWAYSPRSLCFALSFHLHLVSAVMRPAFVSPEFLALYVSTSPLPLLPVCRFGRDRLFIKTLTLCGVGRYRCGN